MVSDYGRLLNLLTFTLALFLISIRFTFELMDRVLSIPELVLLIASEATGTASHELAKTCKRLYALLHRYIISTVTIKGPRNIKPAMAWLYERLDNPVVLRFDMNNPEWLHRDMENTMFEIYRMRLRGPDHFSGLVLSASTSFSPVFASIIPDLLSSTRKLTIVMPEDFKQASLDSIIPGLLYFVDHVLCFQFASSAITILPADHNKTGSHPRDVHITSTSQQVLDLLHRLMNSSLRGNVYLERGNALESIDVVGMRLAIEEREEGCHRAAESEDMDDEEQEDCEELA